MFYRKAIYRGRKDMSYRVAAASTDGKVVNQHFGRAELFHIFEISEDEGYRFLESRKVDACCGMKS